MRVVADSHAVVWHVQGSSRPSAPAAETLAEAEATDGVVVSVATLVDPRYITQTTQKLTAANLTALRDMDMPESSSGFALQPVDLGVVDATAAIARELLTDPWDRFIVGTAKALALPLVTKDDAIRKAAVVPTT